jgi:hypothetical protein
MSEDKFYPFADEWMWNYCIFLGSFTDSEGNNWDLGVHISKRDFVSGAIVHGNESGDYYSPSFDRESVERFFSPKMDDYGPIEAYRETYRRAKEKGLLKRKEA